VGSDFGKKSKGGGNEMTVRLLCDLCGKDGVVTNRMIEVGHGVGIKITAHQDFPKGKPCGQCFDCKWSKEHGMGCDWRHCENFRQFNYRDICIECLYKKLKEADGV
jgi:hypothetical protein